MGVSRRQFLHAAAAGAAVVPGLGAAEPKLPTRPLGKTGITVPILGFGSGSRFLMYEEEGDAIAALDRAIELGVTYVDTANSYGNGKSEERIGKALAGRRGEVTLATKIGARKGDDARRQIEESLKRLRTDRLDVLHIHALSGLDDLAAIEAPDGVLKAVYEARDQKVARAIGITCHAAPEALKAALERHDFDCAQMALNAALARMAEGQGGMKATPMAGGGFEELALPVARRKGMGVIAMKVFGQDQIVGAAPIDELIRYALSLPVSLASLGMPKRAFIERNVAVARAFTPMSDADRKRLSGSILAERKAAMAGYLVDHADV